MKNNLSSIKVLFIFILIIFIFIGNVTYACSPSRGDDWFTSKITIDESTLPKGLYIYTDPDTSYRRLVNPTDIPFYILSDRLAYGPNAVDGKHFPELPSGKYPLLKVVSNNEYYLSEEERSWTINDKHQSYPKGASIGYILDKNPDEMVSKKGDNRPENVKIPERFESVLEAYYGSTSVYIKAYIDYEIKKDYDPSVHAKGMRVCRSPILTLGQLLIFIIIFLAILFSPVLTDRILKAKNVKPDVARVILFSHVIVTTGLLYFALYVLGFV